MKWLLLCVWGLSSPALGGELRLLDLNYLTMDFAKVVNNRDMYWPYDDLGRDKYPGEETWKYGVGVNFDVDLAAYQSYRLHWRNRIDGQQTTVQFRTVAWDFRWGLQLGRKLEVFYDHLSAHVLDAEPESPRTYRLKNMYGLEITFYRRGE